MLNLYDPIVLQLNDKKIEARRAPTAYEQHTT